MMIEWQPIDTAPKDGTRILLMRRKMPKFQGLPNILWIKIGTWRGDWQDGFKEAWREDAIAGVCIPSVPLSPSHWASMAFVDG